MNLGEIVARAIPPEPWAEGENIPWNEPDFSRRMLREHLSQDHDLASRRSNRIALHVEWIHRQLLNGKATRILDLACGPGLYLNALARRGHSGIGIDYSPASFEYARATALKETLACEFRLEDIRTAEYPRGIGMAMLIYGEANVFREEELKAILQRAREALIPNGLLLLEVHTADAIGEIGEASSSWFSSEAGLFSDLPHIVLQENFWDTTHRIATTRYFVLDAATGSVSRMVQSFQAYSDNEYASLLSTCGFDRIERYPSLTGEPDPSQRALQVIVARART